MIASFARCNVVTHVSILHIEFVCLGVVPPTDVRSAQLQSIDLCAFGAKLSLYKRSAASHMD